MEVAIDELFHTFETAPAGGHAVQICKKDQELIASVSQFARQGFLKEEKVLLIGSQAYLQAIQASLRSEGMDTAQAQTTGWLVLFDAQHLLSQFMIGDMPDWARFRKSAGTLIEGLQPDKFRVRAWGEMVNILWRDKNAAAAVKLEEYWNMLGREFPFFLLCTYLMDPFTDEPMSEGIFKTHSCTFFSPDFSRIEQCIDLALKELLGSTAVWIKKVFLEKNKGHLHEIPRVQMLVSWLQRDMPISYKKILGRAQTLYKTGMPNNFKPAGV